MWVLVFILFIIKGHVVQVFDDLGINDILLFLELALFDLLRFFNLHFVRVVVTELELERL